MTPTRLLPPAAFVLLAVAAAAPAQDKKAFTLRWHGQSFFSLEAPAGKKLAFDPHAIPEFGRPQVSADVILCSHLHDDHAQPEVVDGAKSARVFFGLKEKGKAKTPDWNRIDEKVGGIRVRTLGTYHDRENGMTRGKNAVFIVESDGLVFCHLGDLGHELSEDQVKAIGPVDVLMVPVGGVYTINGTTARKVVAALKPKRFVIPMHYAVPGYDDLLPADEFLEGLANVKKTPTTNELLIPLGPAPADGPQVVLLHWQKAGK